MFVAAIALSAALVLSAAPAPVHADPVGRTATAASDRDDRELALNRPTRSGAGTMRVVQRASAFPRSLLRFASCVLDRESGGTLHQRQSGSGARNPSSSASGRWQFLDNSWREGLSFMVRDRLVRFGMPKAQAREVRLYLAERPIHRWHGYWQDIGFLEVIHRGGRHHWNGGSHSC